MEYLEIQKALLKWFKKHKRNLPWRKNRTWYKVWISEIMLQQTQVNQVEEYYRNFIKIFPKNEDLAQSDLQTVLKIWEGLGYYSRARNLHKAAQIIEKKYNGNFPSTKSEIIKLPGIGEYTANAILSFVYNKPYSVVDGNVIRVIARIFGITSDIRDPKTLKQIKSKTDKFMPLNDSANYNESVMEVGALVCKPKNPNCNICPVQNFCVSLNEKTYNVIPFKSKKTEKPVVKVLSQIVKKNNKYLIVKRKENGLLGGYWEFPSKNVKDINDINKYKYKLIDNEIRHSYTHFNLLIFPVFIKENELELSKKLYVENIWAKLEDINRYPIHKAMQKVLKLINNN